MRKKIVAGNWKMNTTPVEGVELAKNVVAFHTASNGKSREIVVLC